MNAKCAIAKAFLIGETLSIKTAFNLFGVTNLPREVSRQIEKPFNIKLIRTQREGKTKYGIPCTWFEYRLKRTEENKPGIELMQAYIKEQENKTLITTNKQLKQINLL